jgi:hypothetical protein
VGFIYSVYPCPAETLRASNLLADFSLLIFTLCPFETKMGIIFFVLDRECIFKPVKVLSQNGQRGSLLVCDWLHSI